MKSRLRQIASSAGLKQSIVVVGGNGLATGVAAISLIIFSRVLGPENFGVFSIGFSIMQLMIRLSDLGVNVAVQRGVAAEEDQKTSRRMIVAGTKYKIVISALVILLGLWLAPLIAVSWLKTDNLKIVQLGIILSAATIAYEYVAVLLQSVRKFYQFIAMALSQAMVKVLLAIWIFWTQITDAVTAFWLYALAPLAGVVVGGSLLPGWVRGAFKEKPLYEPIVSVAKFTSISVVAAAIGDNIDVLMVKAFLSEYETGLFAVGARISLLISVLAYSLGTVLSPRVARYKAKYHFMKYLRKSMVLIAVLLLGGVLVIPLAGPLTWLTAGPEYMEATKTVGILLASGMVVVATVPIVAMFYSLKNPEYFALSGIVQTIVLVAANYILIPSLGIEGAGFARLISRLSVFLFSLVFAVFSIRKQFRIKVMDEISSVKNILE